MDCYNRIVDVQSRVHVVLARLSTPRLPSRC